MSEPPHSPDRPLSPAALTYHYETQCLPTPASWFAHHLPVWLHKLSVVATFLIEIAMPPLFFMPARRLRLAAFYSQVGGASAIRETGGTWPSSALLSRSHWGQGGCCHSQKSLIGRGTSQLTVRRCVCGAGSSFARGRHSLISKGTRRAELGFAPGGGGEPWEVWVGGRGQIDGTGERPGGAEEGAGSLQERLRHVPWLRRAQARAALEC